MESNIIQHQVSANLPNAPLAPQSLLLLGRRSRDMASTLLALGLLLLLLLLLKLRNLILLLALRVPLPSLQDQHANQHKRQDGIARSQDPQAVFPADHDLAVVPWDGVRAERHDPQPLDDVGDVHDDADDIEDQRRAVEEQVRFTGLEQLDEEAGEADRDGDVQDARDDGRRGVQKLEVRLQLVVVRGGRLDGGPEERVVVGEGGEEDPEEETCCCLLD